MTSNLDTRVYAYISSSWVRLLDIDDLMMSWGMSDKERVSDVDELNLVLNNSDGRYTPGGPSALAGWDEGLQIKVEETFEFKTIVRFLGRISKINIPSDVGDIRVTVTVLGWMDNAMRYPVITPPLLTNATISDGIGDILEDIAVQPKNTRIADGSFVFDRLFDDTREKTKAYTEIVKFVNSELGRAYVRHDEGGGETFVLESLETRNGTNTITKIPTSVSILTDGSGNELIDGDGNILISTVLGDAPTFTQIQGKQVVRGEDVVNNYDISVYPKKIDADPVLIYESEEPLFLAAGETKTFNVAWTDPAGKRKINAVPPGGPGNVVSLCNVNEMLGAGQSSSTGYFYGYIPDETGKYANVNDAPFVSFPVYSKGSAFFDGSLAWLEYNDSPDWDFGSGDFTIRFWVYAYNTNINEAPFSRDGSAAFPPFIIKSDGAGFYRIYLSSTGASFDISAGTSMGTISINEWHLYEVGRRSGTLYTFKDGVLITTASGAGTILASSSNLFLGKNQSTYFGGNITEWMIVKGECLHTTTYQLPFAVPKMREGVYWESNTNSSFSATNVKDLVSVTGVYGTEGATLTVTSSATTPSHTLIKVYGRGIYSNSSIKANVNDDASIQARGEKTFSLSQPYQVRTDLGKLEANKVVELQKNPRTFLKSITYIPHVSDQLLKAYLYLDIGDLVPVQITADGIDSYYYIQNIKSVKRKGADLRVTYGLEQAWTIGKDLSYIACEFAGSAATDRITFEYSPIVSANSVTYRVFSAWVYLDSVTAARNQMIFSTNSGESGIQFYVSAHATDVLLAFKSSRYSTAGTWITSSANPFTTGAWAHVFVAYDHTSPANDPIVYVNGSLKSLTESVTPTGSAVSEEGATLVIGNNSSGATCFDGKIKDARIYNVNKTSLTVAQLAAGLYADGAGGDSYYQGMKFNAFSVRTADLAGFENLTLTNEKILDAYMGYVGSPTGSPITRFV